MTSEIINKAMNMEEILRPQLKSGLIVMATLCVTLVGCGSGGDDPVVAQRELRTDEVAASAPPAEQKREDANARFAAMALDCVNKQFPNKISHVINSAEDVRSPAKLYPSFYGCFDWHSSVHGHWLITRLWGQDKASDLDGDIEAALARSFTEENIAAERVYFMGEGRGSFERPYGMAWFLQLMAELRGVEAQGGSKGEKATAFVKTLAPLETIILEKLKDWLPKLAYPIRSAIRLHLPLA